MYFIYVYFVGFLRIINRMRVFENRVLRKIYGAKRDEGTMGTEKSI
jgi:hypothetical protein